MANGGCHAEAICTNTDGGRSCRCGPGFTGDGIQCRRGAVGWQLIIPDAGPVPSARHSHAAAFDPGRGKLVLFGGGVRDGGVLGDGGARFSDETWEWDGAHWTQVALTGPRPPPGGGYGMVYDTARSRILLHAVRQNWEFDGTAWTQVGASGGPSSRSYFALSHDSTRRRTVLFGGQEPDGLIQDDTWEWSGTAWTRVATSGPPARTNAKMVFDPVRAKTVLAAGRSLFALTDTWEWNGRQWDKRNPVTPIPVMIAHVMAYEPTRMRTVVIHAGSTLEWNGSNWLDGGPGPTSRSQAVLVFDSVRDALVFVGEPEVTAPGSDRLRVFEYSVP